MTFAWNELIELQDFAQDKQWDLVSQALARYSRGEISDLVALGIIGLGLLVLDKKRRMALRVPR
jgi:hypothetical protein